MRITISIIKEQFAKAEVAFEFCWQVLADIKDNKIQNEDFSIRFILFQEKLAQTLFDLQSLKSRIQIEEKNLIKSKKSYKIDWFVRRMRLLSNLKNGVENVVNIGKAFGDAYAYFFYQYDLELLAEHYTHQKVVSDDVGVGGRGELEFVRQIKQLNGDFTLFHGITNILRYGDYSFIDLKSLKIKSIGELKTSLIDNQSANLKLIVIKRNGEKRIERVVNKGSKHRRERQLVNIHNFLNGINAENKENIQINNYSDSINELIKNCSVGEHNISQVSNGLTFACLRIKRAKLFTKIFSERKIHQENLSDDLLAVVNKTKKENSENNGMIMGRVLYNSNYSDNATPGTVPLFWLPIETQYLKKLYFADCFVLSFFNPAYLIEDIQNLGFTIISRHIKQNEKSEKYPQKMLENFEFFISPIINYLSSEEYVLITLKESEKFLKQGIKVEIKPHQSIPATNRR